MEAMPKRKFFHQTSYGLLDLVRITPVEFLSPLTLDECKRRLQMKDHATRLDVDLDERTSGETRFILTRKINRKRTTEVKGTLHYWDEARTLVKCRTSPDVMRLVVALGVSALVGLLGSLFFWIVEWVTYFLLLGTGYIPAVVAVPLLVAFALLTFFINHIYAIDEKRALIHMVEDLLHDPLINAESQTALAEMNPFLTSPTEQADLPNRRTAGKS